MDHPHIHCVVPAGAIADDGVEWINARKGFLFPVDVLNKVYRGKFMEFFKEAVTNKSIQFHGILQEIIPKYRQFIDTLYNTDWVVYLKESFALPVLQLLKTARYFDDNQRKNVMAEC